MNNRLSCCIYCTADRWMGVQQSKLLVSNRRALFHCSFWLEKVRHMNKGWALSKYDTIISLVEFQVGGIIINYRSCRKAVFAEMSPHWTVLHAHLVEISHENVTEPLATVLDALLSPPLPSPPPLAFEIERLWKWLCHLESREPVVGRRALRLDTSRASGGGRGGCRKGEDLTMYSVLKGTARERWTRTYKTRWDGKDRNRFAIAWVEVWGWERWWSRWGPLHILASCWRALAKIKQTVWLLRADEREQRENSGGYCVEATNSCKLWPSYIGVNVAGCRVRWR